MHVALIEFLAFSLQLKRVQRNKALTFKLIKTKNKKNNEMNINTEYRDVWIKTLPKSVSHQKRCCCVLNFISGSFHAY